MAPTPEQVKAAKLAERYTKANLRMTDAEVRQVNKLVNEARADIVAAMSRAPADSYTHAYYRRYLRIVDERLNQLDGRLITGSKEMVEASAVRATAEVKEWSAIVEGGGFNPTIPMEVVEVSQAMTTGMVTDVTQEARARMRHILQRGMIAKRPMIDLIDQVGRNLRAPSVFGTIAKRAEIIVRTESGRVYNVSKMNLTNRYAAMYNIRPGKVWIATHDTRTREAHEKAHGQVVPYDEPFIVDDEELMYPLDPMGSPRNTILCRCCFATVPMKNLGRLAA